MAPKPDVSFDQVIEAVQLVEELKDTVAKHAAIMQTLALRYRELHERMTALEQAQGAKSR